MHRSDIKTLKRDILKPLDEHIEKTASRHQNQLRDYMSAKSRSALYAAAQLAVAACTYLSVVESSGSNLFLEAGYDPSTIAQSLAQIGVGAAAMYGMKLLRDAIRGNKQPITKDIDVTSNFLLLKNFEDLSKGRYAHHKQSTLVDAVVNQSPDDRLVILIDALKEKNSSVSLEFADHISSAVEEHLVRAVNKLSERAPKTTTKIERLLDLAKKNRYE